MVDLIMAKQHSPRFLQIVQDAKQHVAECTVGDVKKRLDVGEHFHLVDVREAAEYDAGRLPGAVHLSKGVIERDVEKTIPDASAPIVLYCGGGYRSALAAWNLEQMGYENVVSMDGGWSGWKEAGYEVERD